MLDEDTIATHRVVQVVPDDTDATVVRFQTKGDANDAVDGSLVHYKNVIGTPIFSIPYLGYVSNYITNPPGMYIGFTVLGLIILMLFAPDLLKAADAADAAQKYAALYDKLALPTPSVTAEEREQLVSAVNPQRLQNNPIPLSAADIRGLLTF